VARAWTSRVRARTAFSSPGSPQENGYVESFNGKLRDERLNAAGFHMLAEAHVLFGRWRQHYNTEWPHWRWDTTRRARGAPRDAMDTQWLRLHRLQPRGHHHGLLAFRPDRSMAAGHCCGSVV
jgi:transposase InsO family protein